MCVRLRAWGWVPGMISCGRSRAYGGRGGVFRGYTVNEGAVRDGSRSGSGLGLLQVTGRPSDIV